MCRVGGCSFGFVSIPYSTNFKVTNIQVNNNNSFVYLYGVGIALLRRRSGSGSGTSIEQKFTCSLALSLSLSSPLSNQGTTTSTFFFSLLRVIRKCCREEIVRYSYCVQWIKDDDDDTRIPIATFLSRTVQPRSQTLNMTREHCRTSHEKCPWEKFEVTDKGRGWREREREGHDT